MNKKLIALILIGIISASLVGCSDIKEGFKSGFNKGMNKENIENNTAE